MKYLSMVVILGLLASPVSYARDDVGDYEIGDLLSAENVDADIAFYFGDQAHGKVAKNYGEFRTNKKTNAFNKSDEEACGWAFLSAIKSLRDRARREGGNAVINIRSNYKSNETSSDTTFQCGAGKFVAGVALIGDVVTLE